MRTRVVMVASCFMLVGLTGCQSWWNAPNVHGVWDNATTSTGKASCTVQLPSDQPSGWVHMRATSSLMYDGTNWVNNVGGIIGRPQFTSGDDGGRFWQSKDTRMLWKQYASQGDKPIVGIYPGETYHMGFIAYQKDVEASIGTYVANGSGATLSTVSNCALQP